MAERPTGFVAKCRCGKFTGAMDLERTGRAEAGKMLGAWLFDGKTVEPRFGGTWSQHLEGCACKQTEKTMTAEKQFMSTDDAKRLGLSETERWRFNGWLQPWQHIEYAEIGPIDPL